jgi:hypothetical protein
MIINTSEEIREVLPNVAIEVKFEDFKTHLESADLWLSKDLLGPALFKKLDEGTVNDPELSRLVKKLSVLKSYQLGIPFMDLIQTATGFGVINDKNRAPASRLRVDALIKQVNLNISQETEWLLDYLEANAQYHTDWKESKAFSLLSDCLIATAKSFSSFGNPITRDAYLKLKPDMLRVQYGLLKDAFSENFIQELISLRNSFTLIDEYLKAFNMICLCLAPLALAEGIDNMNILIDGKGVFNDYVTVMSANTDLNRLQNASSSYHTNGLKMIDRAITFFENNLDSFPEYRDSEERLLNQDKGFENTSDNPVFIFKGGI